MNILMFEYHNFGTEDVKECFEKNGHKYRIVETDLFRDRVNAEFDKLFEKVFDEGVEQKPFDCVFTFNYSPVISNNCKSRNIPYICLVYDSPQVLLYSYTIINPCNYVFIFDKTQYLELKNEGINTVYYAPLCVNVDRMKRMMDAQHGEGVDSDITFVGSLYDEKHNLFDRLEGISDFTRGYLDSVMDAQMKVYGYFFLEQVLNSDILADMQKAYPVKPSSDGVETEQYLYAHYFLARKLANRERSKIMETLGAKLGDRYDINLFTPNKDVCFSGVKNRGPIDYYEHMPYVFNNSRVNLNITLRSIRSGIPLRGMDIIGAGGFLLSNYQEDFFDAFNPGEDLVMFESLDDLVVKCEYYLKHDSERAQIAQNGYGKVKDFHTYDIRFKQMFDIVFN